MPSDLGDAIKRIVESGISEDLVISTVEDFLKAAYKRKFGSDANAVITFNDDLSSVELSSRKIIVDEDNYYNTLTEISIEEAKEYNEEAEIGDVILIPIDINKTFDRISVQSAKQKAHQSFRDIQKDSIYSEFKNKEGCLINGYFNRQIRNDIFVNIGSTEGILPSRYQSPRESYSQDDKIKCYVERVEKNDKGVRVILSRTSGELVRQLFELEVPEINQGQIEIVNVAREAGYRSKVSVKTNNQDIDPVGACVGLKGNRIQTVIKEIEGEKIDVINYDPNPVNYIINALTPAQVIDVVIIDRLTYRAIAIVDESQLSLAIGKGGLNVKLAKKLCDWNIDVKTPAEFQDMEIVNVAKERAESFFMDGDEQEYYEGEQPEVAQETGIAEDEIQFADIELDSNIVAKLQFHDIYTIEEFVNLSDAEMESFGDFTPEELEAINTIILKYVDIVEETEEDEYEYKCPNCGHTITVDMTECPECGTGLAFETVDEEE
ncbi:MAG: transcription termination factor NusA [Sphaerochaetaceae bacterium]|nr:transcription termination factor NusA [Sphaerochaetaceae bacterium]MDC7236546.1 transcription termination factor NusA [Sphaerochaetaceae bacterium]MDC7244262.1 transcription termination factor NusA [Sphaerochaetaceae bacterium]MDC7250764.1 transcription termination factor NusA [Sphaerochaetaceae bacterium]